MKVTFDDHAPDDPDPLSTWQECLPGMGYPQSIAQQATLWELGKPERKPAKPEDPDQATFEFPTS